MATPRAEHCGVLLFYRWEPGIPWTAAPLQLQNVTHPCDLEWVFAYIIHKDDRGRGQKRSPEEGTACALCNVRVRTAMLQRDELVHRLNEIVGKEPLPCRLNNGKPCSALMWLPLEDGVPRAPGRDLELQDFVKARRYGVLGALQRMVDWMEPYLTSDSAKRRRGKDAKNVARAIDAAGASGPVPNSLFRGRGPRVSRELHAELPPPGVVSIRVGPHVHAGHPGHCTVATWSPEP